MGIWAKQSSESPQQATRFQPPHIGAASTLRPRSTLPAHGAGPQQRLPQAGGTRHLPVPCRLLEFVCSDIHSLALPLPSEVFHTVGLKKTEEKKENSSFQSRCSQIIIDRPNLGNKSLGEDASLVPSARDKIKISQGVSDKTRRAHRA